MTNKGAIEMDKLALINSLSVIEHDGNGGELEYVLVANTFDSISVLKQLGASESEINDMTSEDGDSIDISGIGFEHASAKYYSAKHGFIDYIPDEAPEWVKKWAKDEEVSHDPT